MYGGDHLICATVVVTALIQKPHESLIDDRPGQNFDARQVGQALHQLSCKIAAARDHLTDAYATQLADRCIGGESPASPRPLWIPIFLLANTVYRLGVARYVGEDGSVRIRISDKHEGAVKRKIQPFVAVCRP